MRQFRGLRDAARLGLVALAVLLVAACNVPGGTERTPSAPPLATHTRVRTEPTPTTVSILHTPTAPLTLTSEAYSQEEIDYFLEVALGTEYGDSEQSIRKWVDDIRLRVLGSPTQDDLQTLAGVIADIDELVDAIEVKVVDTRPNVELHFVEEEDFDSIEPGYVPVNYGFFWSYWNADNELYKSRIMVSTDEITQAERSHLIREEVTQNLGLMSDSERYQDSIFYEGWTETGAYSEIDRKVIEMLYREDVEPGMTADEVTEVLEGGR